MIYVAHEYGGNIENVKKIRRIVHDLQVADMDNLYISPVLSLAHLSYGEVGFDEEMELCLDLLTVCDKLIVASAVSEGVSRELDFATLVGMEVQFLE